MANKSRPKTIVGIVVAALVAGCLLACVVLAAVFGKTGVLPVSFTVLAAILTGVGLLSAVAALLCFLQLRH